MSCFLFLLLLHDVTSYFGALCSCTQGFPTNPANPSLPSSLSHSALGSTRPQEFRETEQGQLEGWALSRDSLLACDCDSEA